MTKKKQEVPVICTKPIDEQLSMRDQIAVAVLPQIIANRGLAPQAYDGYILIEECVNSAYTWADTMLHLRPKESQS